jgi:hypothetical protein
MTAMLAQGEGKEPHMRNDHQVVLQTILGNPHFSEFPTNVVAETFSIMIRLAPTLAAIPAIAGHWVKAAIIQTYVDVDNVKDLCKAEIAARDACSDDVMRGLAQDAFFAGSVWGSSQERGSTAQTIHQGFDQWWTQGDD